MENLQIVEGLRPVSSTDDVFSGMGLGSAEWRDVCADRDVLRYLCMNDTTKEVYFIAYVAAQFAEEECVHLSLAIGKPDEIHIKEGCEELYCPTVYNATRDIGRSLSNVLSKQICKQVNLDISTLVCLSRLIPGIPQGDPHEDKGLHISLYNKSPGGTAPTIARVKELQRMFQNGVALQLDLADFKIVKGLRFNDMSTGGMYYLTCGLSQKLSALCKLIKERFADSIKSFAPHVSLELWGVAACRHPQQKLRGGADLKFWYCDYLRWGIEKGVFEKCLNADGQFDIARYMYIRTHDKLPAINHESNLEVNETLDLMNGFKVESIDAFIEAVDCYTGFGSIKGEQRLHEEDSSVYKFFEDAPAHQGVDCVQSRIKNCATAAGQGPRWYPGADFTLPTPDVQSHILKFVTDVTQGESHDVYAIRV